MLPFIVYGIIFFVYVGFCLVTMDIFSRTRGSYVGPYLYMFYLYYSLLLSFVLSLIGQGGWLEWSVQLSIQMIFCGVICSYYYETIIMKKFQNSSRTLEWGSRL